MRVFPSSDPREMPFLDHLEELRWRVLWSLLAVIVASVGGFFIVTHFDVLGLLVDPIEPFLGGTKLKYLSPTEPFFITIKLAILVGLILSSPIVVYQIWAFLSPALMPAEKRTIIPALYLGVLLFVGGVAMAYFLVLPMTLRFTMSFQTESLEQSIVIGEYIKVTTRLLMAFGLVFEMPVVIVVLAALGLVTPAFLAEKRRYAYAAITIVSAVITPGDVITVTVMMMAPLILLYELSIVLARVMFRQRLAAPLGAALVLLLLTGSGLSAQQRPPVRDTAAALADSVAAADTTRARPTDAVSDSIIDLLKQLRGFTSTEYQGDRALYRADVGILRLEGAAEVDREGSVLTADTIVFRDRDDIVEAYGKPNVSGQAQELAGDVLFYDLTRRRATALGARTKVSEQATWFVTGDNVTLETLDGNQAVYASHGRFTTCDLEIPHYHFEADRIKIVNDRYLVARPARLYFGKVPVMVLPFIVQNLEQGRRSGLVVPRFSLNDIVRTNSDYTREISQVGWYWAINDYLGAQVTGTWRSEAYTALQASTDFRWRRQFLDGSVTAQRYWREDGRKELNFDARSSWEPNERTDLSFQGRYASSSEFVRESTYDPRETTQDLASTFSMSRRFDWGQVGFGAERRQSIADGSVQMVLPRLTVSPQPVTLFRSATPELAPWYSNTTLQWGLNALRTSRSAGSDTTRRAPDREETRLDGGLQSLTIGNLSLSATGSLNQATLTALPGYTPPAGPRIPDLPGSAEQRGQWQASINYQQRLIGQTTLTPNIGLSQEIRRDSLSGESLLGAPVRMNVGVSMATALFGFFPGVGPFSTIRHRLSPSVGFQYSPQVEQSELQDRVFGRVTGRAQNRVTLSLNQTFEAKVRPRDVEPQPEVGDTLATDSAGTTERQEQPQNPEKVTLLSLSTSPFEYDFVRAVEDGNGFVTERVSNTISSDYLKGLTIQMEHELFDRTGIDPGKPEQRGELGTFAPRLSSLSTQFELGPNNAVVALLTRLLARSDEETENPATQGVFPGNPPPTGTVDPTGAATGNPQGSGDGAWRIGVRYSYTQPTRSFIPRDQISLPRFGFETGASQTLGLDARFILTPNWGVTWGTDYSITDREFGSHNLRFTRDLHRWQANFNFYKTPNGNSAFEFYVELIDNRELKLDYRERNLGIDRRR